MNSRRKIRIAGLLGLLWVSLLGQGCARVKWLLGISKPHDHNLNYVACDNAQILVNANTGTVYEDELVFLCPGQKLTWTASSGTGSFSIDFHNDSPVVGGQSMFSSQNGTIGPLEMDKLKSKNRAKAFKYLLTVGNLQLDPHVIIMGP